MTSTIRVYEFQLLKFSQQYLTGRFRTRIILALHPTRHSRRLSANRCRFVVVSSYIARNTFKIPIGVVTSSYLTLNKAIHFRQHCLQSATKVHERRRACLSTINNAGHRYRRIRRRRTKNQHRTWTPSPPTVQRRSSLSFPNISKEGFGVNFFFYYVPSKAFLFTNNLFKKLLFFKVLWYLKHNLDLILTYSRPDPNLVLI